MEDEKMLVEKCVTFTKYQFSLDGEGFAEGYLFSEEGSNGAQERIFHMGSLRCQEELPVPEGKFLEAVIDDNGFSDGKLMFHRNSFLLSMLGDTSTPMGCENGRSLLHRRRG